MDLPYTISKPASLEDMETAIAFVQDIWTQAGMDENLTSKLHLVLEEALVNIIKYAYSDPSSQGNIIISCGMLNRDKFCVQIKDQGQAFNPLNTEDPDINEDVEKRPIGGLGIYFVKQLSDIVEYKREKNYNIITICFKKQNS